MGLPLVNARIPPGLKMGISLNDGAPGADNANLGLMGARFTTLPLEGDSFHSRHRSRPDAGILGFRHSAFRQAVLKQRHREV